MKIDLGYHISMWRTLGDPLWGSLRYSCDQSINPTFRDSLWLPTRPDVQNNLKGPIEQLMARTLTA